MPSLHGNGTRFDPGQPQFGKGKQTQLPVRARRATRGVPELRPSTEALRDHAAPARSGTAPLPARNAAPGRGSRRRRTAPPLPVGARARARARPRRAENGRRAPPTDGAAPDPGAPLPPHGAPRSGDRTATHEGTARREAPGRYPAEHSPRDPRPPPRAALHGSRGGARPRLRTRPGRHAAPRARAVVGLLRAVGGAVGTARRIAPPGAG